MGKNYLKPDGAIITINGKEYKPQSEDMHYGFVYIDNYENCYGMYIVPDDVDFSNDNVHIEVLMADLKGDKKHIKIRIRSCILMMLCTEQEKAGTI